MIDGAEGDLLMIVDVGDRWPGVSFGTTTAAAAVLTDWDIRRPGSHRFLFDPARVRLALGQVRDRTVAAFDVTAWEWSLTGPTADLASFIGVESALWQRLVGAPCPLRWPAGDPQPIHVMPLSQLLDEIASAAPATAVPQAVLGEVVVTASPEGPVVVTVPAGTRVVIEEVQPIDDPGRTTG